MGVVASERWERRRCAAVWLAIGTLVASAGPAAADESAEVPTDATEGEIDLGVPEDGEGTVLWGPNRFGFGMAVGMALWSRQGSDGASYLWDANGGALLAMEGDYHRMFGDWVGLGGTIWFPTDTDAYFLTGLGVSIGPRVYLWPDWVYVQVEAVVGYPPLVGAIGTFAVSIPLFDGARLRLENQFWLNILEDEAEFTFAWYPAFAAELGF
jgi:hypothetical protein